MSTTGPVVFGLSEGLGACAITPPKACPFCGKYTTLKLMTAQALSEEGDDDPPPWEHSESWAVLCDGSKPGGPGGCGASGGYYPTTHQAVQAWNERA